jgi:hypothetical protein
MERTKFRSAFALILGFATVSWLREAKAETVLVIGNGNQVSEKTVEVDSLKLGDLVRDGIVKINPESKKPEIQESLLNRLEQAGVLETDNSLNSVECGY